MGILGNIFGNKKQKEKEAPIVRQVERQDHTEISETEDGRKIFEHYDANAKFGQFYDTTRVIINKEPQVIEGSKLYDCMVSWFNRDDVVMINEDGKEFGRRTAYEHIIAGINPDLMENDPIYLSAVMKKLFEKSRVERYKSYSLKSEEEILRAQEAGDKSIVACGKYVGNVINSKGNWKNGFIGNIGQIMHNSPEMQAERAAFKSRMQEMKRKQLEQKRIEIAKLQAELDEYEEQEEK